MADHDTSSAVDQEMKNNPITNAMADCHANEYGQTHIPTARPSPSWDFVTSLKLINKEYAYVHDKKEQTGPVVVGFDSDIFIKFSDKASPYYESNTVILMTLSGNYFSQKKSGLVVAYLSRPWSYFPSIMALRYVLRKWL